MNQSKVDVIINLLRAKEFAFMPINWIEISDLEKISIKKEILNNFSEEEVISIYEDFCFFNKNLADEIMRYAYDNATSKAMRVTANPINDVNKDDVNVFEILNDEKEGDSLESLEDYIELKTNYLKIFKEKLEKKSFEKTLIKKLIAEEIKFLNKLSFWRPDNGKQ